MKPGFLLCLMLPCLAVAGSTSTLSVSEIQERGKSTPDNIPFTNQSTPQSMNRPCYTDSVFSPTSSFNSDIIDSIIRNDFQRATHLLMKKTEIRDFVVKQITDETKEDLKKLCKKSAMSLLRGQNKDLLEKFSLKNISNEISSNLPMFWNFLEKCVANPHQGSNKIKQGDALLPQLLSAGAALIHLYNRDMNIFQCINSLIMMKAGCKKSAFNRLNATGTCLSYRSTLDMADKLASGWENPLIQWRSDVELSTSIEEALLRQVETLDETIDILGEPSFRAAILSVELEQVQQSLKDHRRTMHPGYYFIGDNVDLRTQVRQMTMKNQAKDHHMYQMCCYLNRVSGNMLDNNSPIHDVTAIPFSALIPGPADNEKLMENFAFLVAHEWCDNITWLRPFKAALPAYIQHQYMKEMEAKTQRINMGVLLKNEQYNDQMVDICQFLHRYVPHHEDSEEHSTKVPVKTLSGGDYLTFERHKSAQASMANSRNPSARLEGLIPKMEEFHNQAEFLRVLFRALRDSECKIKCKSRKTRIMCGSDGVSYLSKCEIKRARRCEGKNVTIKKKGKCSDSDVPMTKCFQEREEARNSGGRSNSKEVFIPSCTSDGNFAEVQCHKASGYCWCVSKEGKPFPGTSSKNKKPNCRGGTPSPSKVVSRIRRRKGKRKRRVGCSSLERTKFNSNLVRVFTEEYDRSIRIFPTVAPNRLDPVMDTLDKKVVEWKFSEFDKDTDNRLSRKEVKSLRRLVKKFIKPRACAKSFLKYCDSNHDKFIERREWSLCLGVDINKDQTTDVPGPGRKESPTGDSINRLPKLLNPKSSSSSNREEEEDRPFLPPPMLPNSSNMWPGLSKPKHNSKPKPEKKSHDCKSEESSALEQEAENPDGGIFIPRCTVDGKWQRAQCHKSTGYCWCVNENTGHPIGGTSTHGVAPECNFEAERDIQGCEYSEKQAFLFDLMTTMTTELAEFAVNNNNNNTHTSILPSPEPSQSIHERAVRWKFNMLDENSNNLLEKEESSNLKTTLKNSRKKWTRKCSRNFIKYCDENSDKQISLDEWVDCTGINRSLPTHPKRTGKNPFDHFLRDT